MRGRRWLLLGAVLPLYIVGLTYVSLALAVIINDPAGGVGTCAETVLDVLVYGDIHQAIEPFTDEVMWRYFAVPAALVAVTQALFLAPVMSPPQKSGRRRSLLLSFIAAGLVGAGLACGLFLAIVQACRLIAASDPDMVDSGAKWWGWVAAPLAVSWLFWSLLIASFARKQVQPSALQRLIRLLLGATVIEVLVVLPLDIMVRRRTNCYCATGTGHALGLAAWAGLWLAGPGIVLAILSKRRRLWWDTNCARCGYGKGPSPGPTCPECGHEW